MNYPKISIVTPNFNKAHYLEQTIQSVLSQNYPNLEYIIIDGGSTDGSVDIIKKYANRLAYWVSEPDKGMYYAIKKGFDHSTGEIMAWIGSDDMYHHGALSVVAEVFSRFPEVKWLTGYNTHYDVQNRTVRLWPARCFTRLDFLMGDYRYVQQESTFWRRSLWNQVNGVSLDYRLAGDFDLWMRFSRIARLYCVNALVGGFRVSGQQLSKDIALYNQEAAQIIENEPKSQEDYRQIRQYVMRRRIVELLKKMKVLNWQGVEVRLFKTRKLNLAECRITFDHSKNQFVRKPS